MKLLITGSLGFIASNFLLKLIKKKNYKIYSIDKHNYASNINILKKLKNKKNFIHFKLDISNYKKLKKKIIEIKPDVVINFAAESHVDNSILSPREFINSNIIGTFNLLEILRELKIKKKIKLIHISTDEVYGDLQINSKLQFDENSNIKPNSPYSSSKASSDMLVRAWNKTYNMPNIIVRSSNNYGPYQNKEKFIPKIISNIILKKKIPIYGNGSNIRNWIFVEDNIEAIYKILKKGKVGEVYNIASEIELTNINIVKKIIKILNNNFNFNLNFKKNIKFVKDRLGHDKRYSMKSNKLKKIGWKSKTTVDKGLVKTINWFLNEK